VADVAHMGRRETHRKPQNNIKMKVGCDDNGLEKLWSHKKWRYFFTTWATV